MMISRVKRTKEEARATYNKLSGVYDFLSGSFEKKCRDIGLRMIDIKQGENVLEIGFGTGGAIMAMAEAVGPSGRVHGIDLADKMVATTQARVDEAGVTDRVILRRGDATNLPYENDSFDAVFISFTLELFDTPDIPIVLGAIRRVLRQNGRVGVVSLSKTDNPGLMENLYEGLHRRFPKYCDCRPIYVHGSLTDAGFHDLKVRESSVSGIPVEIIVGRKGE